MPSQPKRTTKPPAYWAGLARMPKRGEYLHEALAKQLDAACSDMRTSSRGVSGKALANQQEASRWLIEALYQGYCCLPRLPIALPRAVNAYSPDSTYNLPYGYDVTDRVLKAATKLGFITIRQGRYDPSGKGLVTRIQPSGPLARHFQNLGICWQKLQPPEQDKGVFLNQKTGGENRRLVSSSKHPEIAKMQRNIYEINLFLSKQCIHLHIPDSEFTKKTSRLIDRHTASTKDFGRDSFSCINFQKTFLYRIFTPGSFSGNRLEGGRFYGGWWQHLRKELRPRILIKGFATAECDYSGMAVSCLYAEEGLPMPNDDPYDIGLGYSGKSDPRRNLVKKYVVAAINDTRGTYRLGHTELASLGLTHTKLKGMVENHHHRIRHHFGTGVGLRLQYVDSCIAERVVLHFARRNEVCLPIHDSFIVRTGLLSRLEDVMKAEYRRKLGADINVKSIAGFGGLSLGQPRDKHLQPIPKNHPNPQLQIINSLSAHTQDYSICLGMLSSWESQTFNPEELQAKHRYEEEVLERIKDRRGLRYYQP